MTNSQTSRRWLMAVFLPLGILACGEPETRNRTLQPAEFVDVVVALRQAELEMVGEVDPDSLGVMWERRKAEILDHHGTTEDEVRTFLPLHRDRPGVVAEVWDSIAQRLRAPRAQPLEGAPGVTDQLGTREDQVWEESYR
jgi:hypothetical protein